MNYKRKEVIGSCTLYLGDCREILPELDAVDAVISDPPYGISCKSNGQLFKTAKPIVGDDDVSAYQLLGRMAKCVVAFYSPYAVPVFRWRTILVWNKGGHVGIGGDRKTCWKRDFELIGVAGNSHLNGRRDSAVISAFPALNPPPTGHFCEKPVALMRYLVWKLQETIIADPFMGTGTTGVACVGLGRAFIGVEIDETYFNIACRRIEEAYRQPDLLDGPSHSNQSKPQLTMFGGAS